MSKQRGLMQILAPAKVNLALLVGPQQPNGYHPLCSVMEKISLYDRIRLERRAAGGIEVTGMAVPAENNIAYQAARALEAAAGVRLDVIITLDKQIPVGAGLGGGSSDAAAVLRGLTSLFGLSVNEEQLAAAALAAGADVPFFLRPGAFLATGVGELLEPAVLPAHHLVVAVPALPLSTAAVYARFDELRAGQPEAAGQASEFQQRCRALREALPGMGDQSHAAQCGAAQSRPAAQLGPLLANDLETAAMSLLPAVADLKENMLSMNPIGCLMSGSGSAVFGVFAAAAEARAAAAAFASVTTAAWAVEPVTA